MTDPDILSSFSEVKQFVRKMPEASIETDNLSLVQLRIPEYHSHEEFPDGGVHNSVSNITSQILQKIDDEQFSIEVSEKHEGADGKVAYIEITERG